MNDPDHDLLIEINSNLKFLLDRQTKHELDDAGKHATMEKDIRAAHRRIDWLTISCVLAVVFMGISLWVKG